MQITMIEFKSIEGKLKPVSVCDDEGMYVVTYCKRDDQYYVDTDCGTSCNPPLISKGNCFWALPEITPKVLIYYGTYVNATSEIRPVSDSEKRLNSPPEGFPTTEPFSYEWLYEGHTVCCKFCDDHFPDDEDSLYTPNMLILRNFFGVQVLCKHIYYDENEGLWTYIDGSSAE
ncbi:MAG: hypothetical protein GY928_33810 [Colwellia sp.]|nr:hypothetical protein [Colwellia sp.]